MNEYIILHTPYNKDQGDLIKSILINIKEIDYFYPSQLYADVLTFIKFLPGNTPAIYVKESPAEIEALIMGYSLPEFDEVDDSYKNKPTFSAREINALKDDMEKLKEENAFLKEKIKEENGYYQGVVESYNENIKENAKLKEELSSYKTNLMRYELLHGNTNLHSNPDNPCCRETHLKTRELIWKRATSYEPKLKNCLFGCTDWEVEFDKKIQENKNVS